MTHQGHSSVGDKILSERSFAQLLDELQRTRDSIARSMAGALRQATSPGALPTDSICSGLAGSPSIAACAEGGSSAVLAVLDTDVARFNRDSFVAASRSTAPDAAGKTRVIAAVQCLYPVDSLVIQPQYNSRSHPSSDSSSAASCKHGESRPSSNRMRSSLLKLTVRLRPSSR